MERLLIKGVADQIGYECQKVLKHFARTLRFADKPNLSSIQENEELVERKFADKKSKEQMVDGYDVILYL